MVRNKKVSIILPVFNGERFLEQSIQSCLNQTYQNIELIIVNDCSTDRSLEIAVKHQAKDKRVSIISNSVNKKLPASLNVGHKLARGAYMTWISDDNYFNSNAIEILLKKSTETGADIVYSDFHVIKENATKKNPVDLENASSLLFGNSIGASFLYKRKVFELNEGYNENLHTVEDYDFWLRATFHSNFLHIKDKLYNFRSHEKSLSARIAIKDTQVSREFSKNLHITYLNFLKYFEIKESHKYADLLTIMHQYREINVGVLFKEYVEFCSLLNIVSKRLDFFNYTKLQSDLDLRLRSNIQDYKGNQNINVLFLILRNRVKLLLNYDRKNSIRIIFKCLKLKNA
jgi:glycosyltransferase involved in cell wall biosynthesis